MARSRGWLRFVLAGLVLALVALSCAASFDPPSKVNTLRVLGVSIDRSYPLPGEEITFRMTVTDGLGDPDDPAAGPRDLQIAWIGGCYNPVGDQWFLCFQQLAEQFSSLAGGGLPPDGLVQIGFASGTDDGTPDSHEFTLPIPEDIVSSRPAPDVGPHYGIAIVFYAVCAGTMRPANLDALGPIEEGDVLTLPLECVDAEGVRLGAESFVIGYTQAYVFADGRDNANPPIDGMTFSNAEMAEALADAPVVPRCPVSPAERRAGCGEALADCQSYVLKALVGDVAEIDPDATGIEGNQLREVVWVSYFADGGDLGGFLRLVSDANLGYLGEHEVEWWPPDEPSLVSIWAVARDQRGGQSVVRRYVWVE